MTASASSPPAPRRRRLQLAAGLLVVVLVGAWALPSLGGFSSALLDQARGRLTVKRYGEPMPGGDIYHRLMRDRYGVAVEESGCVLVPGQIRFIEAYNVYAAWRLRSRFGRDVSAECEIEAMRAALP